MVSFLLARTRRLNLPLLRTTWLYALLKVFVLLAGRRIVYHGWQAHAFETPGMAVEIGVLVSNSSSVVYRAPFYGRPLEYFGRLSGVYWPRATTFGIYDPNGTRNASIADRLVV